MSDKSTVCKLCTVATYFTEVLLALLLGIRIISRFNFKVFRVFITVQKTQVQCTANENRTLAECHLGNPFKRDSDVSHWFYLISVHNEMISL